MFLYQIFSFFVQLFLMPFFIRALLRLHQVPFQNAVHLTILQITNRFVYPFSRWIAPQGRYDWPTSCLILLVMFILAFLRNIMLVGHALGFFSLMFLVLLEAANRVCIIYISSGLLSYSSLILNSTTNKPLLDITHELTNWQFKKISYLMRQVPLLRQHFLKGVFWIWLLVMIMINLSFERLIYAMAFA